MGQVVQSGSSGGPGKVTLSWTLIRTCLHGDGSSGQNLLYFGPDSAQVLREIMEKMTPEVHVSRAETSLDACSDPVMSV